MTITSEQKAAIISAASLIGRWAEVLADFEAALVRDLIDRFRTCGDRTVMTANEWRVLEESVSGMFAAGDDRARSVWKGV